MDKIELFDGITLSFVTYGKTHPHTHESLSHVVEINYCKEGRMGWDPGNGNKIFLGHGDFSIQNLATCAHSEIIYPNDSYTGLNILIDLKKVMENPLELLKDQSEHLKHLYTLFCENSEASSFTGNDETEGIFRCFYEVPENLRLSYARIKIIEFILYLIKTLHAPAVKKKEYRDEQIEIIKKVHDYMVEHIDEHITIESLAKTFGMNPTTLKSTFRDIYGDSIAIHTKHHRMEHAAYLLKTTDLTLSEISQRIGYESQSKFTAAFKEFFSILPSEFRKISKD
ncbi:MAG: AraC family transcriptional regulator [Clostridia bacterium]|nr:AraC family transcriptional regulator [Clostridia bacterium]